MKPSTSETSFPHARRMLIASALAVLFSAGPAAAQTGSGAAGSTSSGSSQKNPSSDASGTSGSSSSDRARRSQSGSTSGTSGTTSGTTGSYDTTSSTGSTRGDASSSGRLGWGDRRFVMKAADSGMDEVNLAQLAAQRATSSEVKSFAQKLVDDHTKVNSELQSMASQKNVKIDTDDDKDRTYKRLNKKSGSDFDQEFVEHMIDEHEKDIKLFEKAANDAKDSEVRAFASKHVGHLREHLQQAQSLRQSLMPTGRSDTTSGRSTSGGATGSGLGTSSTGSSTSDTSTTPSTSGSSTGGSTYGTGSSSSTSGAGSTSGTSGTSGTGSSTSGSSSDTTRRR